MGVPGRRDRSNGQGQPKWVISQKNASYIRPTGPAIQKYFSWYGESVGHYDADTLVVDTIGFNDRTFVDSYRTPHTDKLHVTNAGG